MSTSTVERDIALQERKDTQIRKTLSLLQAELDLRDYEAEKLRAALNRSDFFEFWFPGPNGSSLKVILTNAGVPFVYDQYRVATVRRTIDQVNQKLGSIA